MSVSEIAQAHQELILDGTKIQWHLDRVAAWERGERIAPITIDMALTRACNYACGFCFAMMQENKRAAITKDVIYQFLDDCAEIGVKGISLVSDGESTLSPIFVDTIKRGHSLGIAMAVGSNGSLLNERRIEEILPHLTYFRVNFSGGEKKRYAEIMGVKESMFDKVCANVKYMMKVKKEHGLKTTIGLQMVLMPQDQDQILPMARIGKELGVDYTIIKHCSDNEDGYLGVDYDKYESFYHLLEQAEKESDGHYKVYIKWSKIKEKGKRSYSRCYGPPFLIQLSGSGLIAPCGMLFNERYKKLHMGNITTDRFRDILAKPGESTFGDRYWQVVEYLASEKFDAKTMCGSLCLQHRVNSTLDNYKKGRLKLERPSGGEPQHIEFV